MVPPPPPPPVRRWQSLCGGWSGRVGERSPGPGAGAGPVAVSAGNWLGVQPGMSHSRRSEESTPGTRRATFLRGRGRYATGVATRPVVSRVPLPLHRTGWEGGSLPPPPPPQQPGGERVPLLLTVATSSSSHLIYRHQGSRDWCLATCFRSLHLLFFCPLAARSVGKVGRC